MPALQPAPAPPSGPVIDTSWRAAVAAWLAAHKRYPETAREMGEEGVVGVAFTLARDGRVLSVAIPRSSGVPALDAAVRAMLEGERLPPFPASMIQAQAEVAVNIRYKLDR